MVVLNNNLLIILVVWLFLFNDNVCIINVENLVIIGVVKLLLDIREILLFVMVMGIEISGVNNIFFFSLWLKLLNLVGYFFLL